MRPWHFEPATDFGLTPRARLASLKREAGLGGSIAHLIWSSLTRSYLAVCHRFEVVGRENLPSAPPYLVISNHSSHLDAIALSACLPIFLCNRIFPIAAGDVFFDSLPVSVFAALVLNALPMWRHRVRPAELATLRDRLASRQCIYILFPEGTRARDGVLSRFKPGLGKLVAGTSIPVVPCYIAGAFQALPPQRWLPRPRRLTVTVGQPQVFASVSNDKAGWLEVAEAAELAVRRLTGGDKKQYR